jgi:ABC-type dipeptide/oligopeptide/nickel transport system permease component
VARYLLGRLVAAVVTVYVVITANFLLFRVLPGDAVTDMSRVPGGSPELREALQRQFGLDRPLLEQYLAYLRALPRGDWGVSYATSEPVLDRVGEALGNTLPMVTIGLVLAIVIGVASGVLAAWRRGSLTDQLSTNTAIVFYSVPSHFLGLVLVIVFGGILPTQGMSDPFAAGTGGWAEFSDRVAHLTLPALTFALIVYGQYTLVTRTAVLEALGQDYALTARAIGMRPRRALWRHVLPTVALPIITLAALNLGALVGGSILIETVYSWPGIGRALYESVVQRDYPMMQGVFLVLAISVVLCNLAADLLSRRLDPRIAR